MILGTLAYLNRLKIVTYGITGLSRRISYGEIVKELGTDGATSFFVLKNIDYLELLEDDDCVALDLTRSYEH